MPKGDYAKLKADIEDGMVPVAHLLLEALGMAKLNGVAKGLVLFIWRRTYGWTEEGQRKHKDDRITLAEFAAAVNSERTYVSTQLKSLVRAGVIFESQDPENGRYKRYGMNTEVSQWSSNVLALDKLVEAANQKLYVHSSKNVGQMHNGLVNAQPFANTQPLCEYPTKPLCESTTFASQDPLPGANSRAPKESIKKIKDVVVVVEDARAEKPVSLEDQEREVEVKMQVRTTNFNYRLVGKDFSAYQRLRTEGVDLQYILDGIDEAFETYQPKHSMDTITSFLYCAKRILSHWTGEQSKKTAASRASPDTVLPLRPQGGRENGTTRKHGESRRRDGPDTDWADANARFFGDT